MAAEAFVDGRDPFHGESLTEYAVTASECIDLSDNIAAILVGYLAVDQETKDILMMTGVLKFMNFPEEVIQLTILGMKANDTLRKMANLSKGNLEVPKR
jgi:hypothetical protein